MVWRFSTDPLLRLGDGDVEAMASSLASTLQTAAVASIYEHRPRSLAAQRLSNEVKAFLDQARGTGGGSALERDAALVLERMRGRSGSRRHRCGGGGPGLLSRGGRASSDGS